MQLLKIVLAGLVWVAGVWGQTGVEQRRYETVFYPSGNLRIEAYVYKPEGAGPFPVVIYNHGSRAERDREEMRFIYVGSMLTASGYVVVVPERRGYGKSDGQTFGQAVGEDRGPRFVRRVQEETDDVLAAVEYVKTLPYVDSARIGVMGGHSEELPACLRRAGRRRFAW
jgi:dipeptidyl aminopeptidase/acylaminoacyl peptidase